MVPSKTYPSLDRKNKKKMYINPTHNRYGQNKIRRSPTRIGFLVTPRKNAFLYKVLSSTLTYFHTLGRYVVYQ